MANKKKSQKKKSQKKKSQKKRKRVGFKEVNFFSGLDTPSKKDDKRISFVARNRGKRSPLELPRNRNKNKDSLFGLKETRQSSGGIPTGLLERGGLGFDKQFGLGKGDLFKSKIGVDPGFGKGKFDVGFSEDFASQKFDIGPSKSFDFSKTPTMISDDFEEPNDENIFGPTKETDDNIFGDDDDVPTLLDSVKNLGDSKTIPLDPLEEDEMSREEKLERKFIKVRQESLATGGNALSPEEERNFEAGPKFTRNFGTTGKKSTGLGFGRF